MNTARLLDFYKQHVKKVILPFWFRALDHEDGGVYTCFSNAGDKLISKDKYTWSQGRFLWLWARIAKMISEGKLEGEAEPYYKHLQKTAHFLEENVFLENGNCAFLLTKTGEKKESIPGAGYDTSFYADCFVALGIAAYAELKQDIHHFERAAELYDRIRERINSRAIRSEPYPVPEGYKAHSVPMIMLNVSQQLADAAETLEHSRSKELNQHSISYMEDIMNDFYLDDHRIVEMMPLHSSGDDSLLYRHVNPGHTIESMWFVIDTAQKTGNTNYIHRAIKAIEEAVNIGWDGEYGGVLRFVDKHGGKPKGKAQASAYGRQIMDSWDMKLWWPHSEALYATLRAYRLTNDEKMLSLYEQIENYVFNTFPNPDTEIGEWIQIRNRKGNPIDDIAALPVKDPFHILRNMLLIIDLLEEADSEN